MQEESEDSGVMGAQKAIANKEGRFEDAAILDQRIRVARIIRYIQRELKGAPPLTDEQVGRLTAAVNAGKR